MVRFTWPCAAMLTWLQHLPVVTAIHLLLWLQVKPESARPTDIITWLSNKAEEDYDKIIDSLMKTNQSHVANILTDPTPSASGGFTVAVANVGCNLTPGCSLIFLQTFSIDGPQHFVEALRLPKFD